MRGEKNSEKEEKVNEKQRGERKWERNSGVARIFLVGAGAQGGTVFLCGGAQEE